MPYLMVQTNVELDNERRDQLITAASEKVAALLGKPERYVMIAVESGVPMSFAGEQAPCVYLELKSIGLPDEQTTTLSSSLAALMEHFLGISQDRVYIEFANAERHMWGFDGKTFAG